MHHAQFRIIQPTANFNWLFVFRICLILTLLGCSYLLRAQDRVLVHSDTLRKADTLKKVIITKQAFGESANSPTPAQTLSKKELGALNSTSVADAIKFFSGVQVKDYGGIGGMKTVEVRGLSTNHSSIFYNGIAINNAQNGQVDLGRLSLDNIESITLFNGQQSKLLLPAKAFSSASVLYLEAQKPSFTEGRKSKLKAQMRFGDFGLVNPSFLWQQKLSESTSLSFNTEWVKAHGQYDFCFAKGMLDTLVNRKNTDIDALRLESTLQGVLKDSSTWSVTLYNYLSDRGLPGAAVDNKFYSNDRQWDKEFFAQGKWEKKFSESYSLLFNTKYNYSYLRYLNPDFNNSKGMDNRFKQNESYLSVSNLFVLSKSVRSSLSVDYLHNTLDANLKDFAYPTRNTVLLNAAVDWKHKGLTLQANGLTTLWSEQVRASDSTMNKQAFSPSLSASWKPFPNQGIYLRSFYKSIFRAPTFNDSYYTLIGSTKLNPEYVNQYNVGFTWQKAFEGVVEQLSLTADAYHHRVKDKIVAIPRANLFSWTMVNLGKVEVNGFDLGISSLAKPNEYSSLDFGINYTYQKALDKTPNNPIYNMLIPYAPVHSGSFFATANYKSYGLNYNTLYSGERYSLRPNTPENLLNDWFIQNLSASYQNKVFKLNYKVLAEVNNITNINYSIIRGYPMPGRNYRFTLQLSY